MKNLIIGIVVGAGAGSGITYILMKKKSEKDIREEVNKFKDEWEKKTSEPSVIIEDQNQPVEDDEEITDEDEDEEDIPDEYDTVDDNNHIPYNEFYQPDEDVEESEEAVKMVEEIKTNESSENSIREISFDEYDRNESFGKRSLTLYHDGTIADEADIVIENIDELIGEENLDIFKESNDEEIYFMNLNLRMCYELSKTDYTFEEFTGYSPEEATVE